MNKQEKRHAYLIIAHTDFNLLRKLISELDDERNDIYIHIDRKSRNFDRKFLEGCLKKSRLIYIPRRNIYWGHYSIVSCEISLLRTAIQNGPYRYYHLISGQDFPIRSQDYIHEVFDNSNLEYITSWECMTGVDDARNYTDSYSYYYFMFRFLDKYRYRFGHPVAKFYKKLEKKSIAIQKKIGVDRSRNNSFAIYKGDQWFSITDAFARYVVSKEGEIRKKLKYTMAPDEMLLATLAQSSEFKETIAYENFRLIDWNRGTPYTFGEADYDEVISSDKLFVRKVSEKTSTGLILRLMDYIKEH